LEVEVEVRRTFFSSTTVPVALYHCDEKNLVSMKKKAPNAIQITPKPKRTIFTSFIAFLLFKLINTHAFQILKFRILPQISPST
jgi:hypothetical protein